MPRTWLALLLALPLALAAARADEPRREALVIVKGVATPYSMYGIVKRLKQVPGVDKVKFDLEHGLADVTLKPGAVVTDDALREAVRNASFTPGEINWKSPAPRAAADPPAPTAAH